MRLGLVFVLIGAVAGCTPAVDGGQVVAKVNGEELTIHQFDQILKSAGSIAETVAAKKAVADKLVDRELAVQKAIELKLDRQREVMLQLEEARREVLARAYATKIVAEYAQLVGPPTDNDVAGYFKDHPALFTERRIYRLREVILPLGIKSEPEAGELLAQKVSAKQFLAFLEKKGIQYQDQIAIRAAEQLPLGVIDKLKNSAAGDSVIFEAETGVLLYEVIQAQAAPLTLEAATPYIRNFITRQQGGEALSARMAQLRNAAKIERFGIFSELTSQANSQ